MESWIYETGTPPKLTEMAPFRFKPLIFTVPPLGAEAGLNPVIFGCAKENSDNTRKNKINRYFIIVGCL